MIILNALFFVPAMVSTLWILLLAFKRKNLTQRIFFCLLFFCTYYYISYALYISPWTDYKLMVRFDVFNMPVSMMILALNILFVHSHKNKRLMSSKWHFFIFLPALFYLIAGVLLYDLVGLDRAAYCEQLIDEGKSLPAEYLTPAYLMHSFVSETLFNSFSFVGLVITVYISSRVARFQGYRFGDIYRFFFKGATTTTVRAICLLDSVVMVLMMPIALAGRMWMLHHPVFSVIISLLTAFVMFLLCYVEYLVDLRKCTLFQLSHIDFGSDLKKPDPSNGVSDVVPVDDFQSNNFTESAETMPDSLPAMVRQAFDVDHVYRDPELSIVSLADHLGTNRTTLSLAINQVFGINFRQLVTNYRVEAAKRYMLEHPNATQDAIAVECGFSSAQTFNLKFKVATGQAPRAWLLTNHHE